MKILLFEFITGGGCFVFPEWGPPAGSLLEEGRNMLLALHDEFSAVADIQLKIPLDVRCLDAMGPRVGQAAEPIRSSSELDACLEQAARDCDRLLIVAPEINNALLDYTQRLEGTGKLLSAGTALVQLGSDKWASWKFLSQHGIPTPSTWRVDQLAGLSLDSLGRRIVLKPRWGAGSWGVQILEVAGRARAEIESDIQSYLARQELQPHAAIVQPWMPGTPASIAVWRTGRESIRFPAVRQVLDHQSFQFLECAGDLSRSQQDRATVLLEQVLDKLPPDRGYLGIDLVLGADELGADQVIEINPRLTTSFCQTRKQVDVGFVARLLSDRG